MIIPFFFRSVLLFLLIPGLSFAQGAADAGETLRVGHTKDFAVTGNGDAAEWVQAPWVQLPQRTGVSGTGRGGPGQNGAAGVNTAFKLLYSDSGIYCLYRCEDSKITATFTTDFADLYDEDVVEAFFRPDDSLPMYFEYELSPLGHELPLLVPNIGGNYLGWLPFHYEGNRRTRHAAHIGRSGDAVTGWTAEFFIPYTLLAPMTHVPPVKGMRWRANFYRIDYDKGVATWQWRLVRNETFHDYERFGTILFD